VQVDGIAELPRSIERYATAFLADIAGAEGV
jgi:hypothetical protein